MYGRPPTGSLANRPSSRAGGGRAPPSAPGNIPRTAVVKIITQNSRQQPDLELILPELDLVSRFVDFLGIPNRPTTQQGMGGMRLNTAAGPGRQVKDQTYFQTTLRQKYNSIVEETARLNLELDNTVKENSNHDAFEKKADGLAAELRDLQGQLGDYNTLVDKLQTDSGLEVFERETTELQRKNANDSASLDDLFAKRKEKVDLIQKAEQEILQQQEMAESLIKTMDPARQEEFNKMKQENEAYLLKMQQFQSELDLLSKEYAILQQQVSHDLVKQKAASLYEKLAKAKEKKAEFELAIQKSELESGPQERNRLLEQVKNDNLETSAMERKIADYEVKIAQLTKDTSLDTESDPAQVEKQAKFDELVQREKEMQEFMDSFPLTKNEISEQILSTETEITDLLTKIQNLSLRNSSAMPSKESFKDVSNTLSLKNTDLRNSENTVDALAQERHQRLQDLEKVEQLERKLGNELISLERNIDELRTAISSIGDVEVAQANAERMKTRQQIHLQELKARETSAERKLTEISTVYEKKRLALSENETFKHLSSQELKLKQIEGSNFELRDYISVKNSQSNYNRVKGDVLRMTDEINSQLIKISQLAPAR